jgi:hypothetical protein
LACGDPAKNGLLARLKLVEISVLRFPAIFNYLLEKVVRRGHQTAMTPVLWFNCCLFGFLVAGLRDAMQLTLALMKLGETIEDLEIVFSTRIVLCRVS